MAENRKKGTKPFCMKGLLKCWKHHDLRCVQFYLLCFVFLKIISALKIKLSHSAITGGSYCLRAERSDVSISVGTQSDYILHAK